MHIVTNASEVYWAGLRAQGLEIMNVPIHMSVLNPIEKLIKILLH